MDPPEKNLLSNHTKYSLFFNTIYFSLSNVCLKEKKKRKKKKKKPELSCFQEMMYMKCACDFYFKDLHLHEPMDFGLKATSKIEK